MKAEIVTIGDELLRGDIVDSNAAWLAADLWDLSVPVTWMTSCGDDLAAISRALQAAAARAQIVLVTGGLGPTCDDVTVDAVADLLGVGVVTHEPSLGRMRARFERAGVAMPPSNLRQVRVPEGAVVHDNPAGLAPGFEVSLAGSAVFVFPGVPRELEAIFRRSVAPRLAALAVGAPRVARRVFRVFGLGESQVGHALDGLTDGISGVTLHFQVAFPETLVRLVVRDVDEGAARARLDALGRELRSRLKGAAYGEGDDTLATVLGRALRERAATMAVAESCTGGMLGELITAVPGSSDYFVGGNVTYSDEAKRRELGVSDETLRTHGAVSRACAEEMAHGARDRAGSTYAAAITGIAGPGGATADKPVGTVHVAVAGPGGVSHKRYLFPGARDQVRRLACFWAMAMVLADLRGDAVNFVP